MPFPAVKVRTLPPTERLRAGVVTPHRQRSGRPSARRGGGARGAGAAARTPPPSSRVCLRAGPTPTSLRPRPPRPPGRRSGPGSTAATTSSTACLCASQVPGPGRARARGPGRAAARCACGAHGRWGCRVPGPVSRHRPQARVPRREEGFTLRRGPQPRVEEPSPLPGGLVSCSSAFAPSPADSASPLPPPRSLPSSGWLTAVG